MILDRLTPTNVIEIWQPRWHDRTVLIAKHKIGTHNEIVFTKAPSLGGSYYISGDELKSCPSDTNGKIACYAVKLDKLERLDRK